METAHKFKINCGMTLGALMMCVAKLCIENCTNWIIGFIMCFRWIGIFGAGIKFWPEVLSFIVHAQFVLFDKLPALLLAVSHDFAIDTEFSAAASGRIRSALVEFVAGVFGTVVVLFVLVSGIFLARARFLVLLQAECCNFLFWFNLRLFLLHGMDGRRGFYPSPLCARWKIGHMHLQLWA